MNNPHRYYESNRDTFFLEDDWIYAATRWPDGVSGSAYWVYEYEEEPDEYT